MYRQRRQTATDGRNTVPMARVTVILRSATNEWTQDDAVTVSHGIVGSTVLPRSE